MDADDHLTLLRELDRIVHEVAEDLTDAPSVYASHERFAFHSNDERPSADEPARFANDLVREGEHVDAAPTEPELSALEREARPGFPLC